MNKKTVIIFIAIIALGAVAILSLSSTVMSPYVSFAEARGKNGAYVQVIGSLDKDIPVTYQDNDLRFSLQDEKGNLLPVTYSGMKPQNFEHAKQAVVLGAFDQNRNLFVADKILVKCPSKYQKEGQQ